MPLHPVLSTVELLERILLHLGWKQTFAAQRVSRHFRDVIAGSSALQKKLLLLPSGHAPPPTRPENSGFEGRWTSCVANHSPPPGEERWRLRSPMVVPRGARPGRAREEGVQAFVYGLEIPECAHRDGEGSWRGVLVCDPPVLEVFARGVYCEGGWVYEWVGMVGNAEGVRLGDLVPVEGEDFLRRLFKGSGTFWHRGHVGGFEGDLGGVPVLSEEERDGVIAGLEARRELVFYREHVKERDIRFLS